MYMYRWPCSFNTMPQLIIHSDWRIVTSQSLCNFLLLKDLANVQVRAAAEHFLYRKRPVQYRQQVVLLKRRVLQGVDPRVITHLKDSSLITPLKTFLSVMLVSRVSAAMFSELRDVAAANVIELFVQTLVLQTTPILDRGFVTWLHDSLRPCGYHACLLGC
ncbi:hypothetical protein TNCV_42791 [Trichonephila clavipes]|nr:hypothetical protein TNCV_42791 [Trichonephila clavipes]